jgi:FixJ family two-component response regulator
MLSGCKILIANPDKHEVLQLATAFRRNGWSPLSAGDAILTQSIARKVIPSAIVLSSTLPGGGATITLKRLRSGVDTVVTPIVVISTPGLGTKEQFMTAGATDYIERPFEQSNVCEVVRRHLDTELPLALAPAEKIAAPERLEALAAADILDTAPNRLIDFMTRIAATILEVPTALLSIVDKDRQFFKSQFGMPEPWSSTRETPLSHSFCQWVVSGQEDLVVEDARKHPGLKSNLAVRDMAVISYAGSAVFSKQGLPLGSFCAIDFKPRAWKAAELDILHSFAKMCEAAILIERNTNLDLPGTVCAFSTISLHASRILKRKELYNRPFERELLLEVIEQQSLSLTKICEHNPKAARHAFH